jgi:hypothetical protein
VHYLMRMQPGVIMNIKCEGYTNSGQKGLSTEIALPCAPHLSSDGSGEHHCWYKRTHFNAAKSIFPNCELIVSLPVVFMKCK